MNYISWLELSLVILLGTVGQVSLKYALGSAHEPRRACVKASIIVWLSCYVVTTVLWLLALRSIPLSQAFPILGLQYALIPLVSTKVLNERMASLQWGGVALIVLGVALVGRS